MKLKENEKIPNSEIYILENGEPTKKKIEELLKNKKAVIFGLRPLMPSSQLHISHSLIVI